MKIKKELIYKMFLGLIVIIIGYIMFFHTEVEIDVIKNNCIRTTLDQFNECVDIGYKSTGFLSGNNYYLCEDEIEITKKCIQWEEERYKKNTTIANILTGEYRR